MNTRPNKVIFSVERWDKSQLENESNTLKALDLLRRDGYNPAVGSGVYADLQGVVSKEVSILLWADFSDAFEVLVNDVVNLARMFNQESILLVDNEDNARLYFIDADRTESLGRLTEVSEAEALSGGTGYSIFGGRYWICKR